MTRIDPFSPDQREAIKDEIKQELRHEEKVRRAKRMALSFSIALLIVAIPALLVAATLAKTGFVDVPVFSKWLYRPTAPSRVVVPLYGSKPADIYRIIGTKITFDPTTSLARLPITEAEITTISQKGAGEVPPDALPFPVKTMQVAFDPGIVEIFAVSPQKNRDATVLVRFKPKVKDGQLSAEVERIQIGSLAVPKKLGDAVFAAFGSIVNEAVVKSVGEVGTLMGVEVEKGIVRFVILPKVR